MSEQFVIPANPDDALALLGEVSSAFLRNGWKRTALIYALTYEGENNSGGIAPDGRLSTSRFAELEYIGLKSQNSVVVQRRTWALAMRDGLVGEVRLGESVPIPDADWLEYFNRANWKLPESPAEALALLGGASEKREPKPRPEGERELPSVTFMRRKRFHNLVNASSRAVKRVNEVRVWDGVPDQEDIALLTRARDQFGQARDGLDEIMSRESSEESGVSEVSA
jgi:hypothetical protein